MRINGMRGHFQLHPSTFQAQSLFLVRRLRNHFGSIARSTVECANQPAVTDVRKSTTTVTIASIYATLAIAAIGMLVPRLLSLRVSLATCTAGLLLSWAPAPLQARTALTMNKDCCLVRRLGLRRALYCNR